MQRLEKIFRIGSVWIWNRDEQEYVLSVHSRGDGRWFFLLCGSGAFAMAELEDWFIQEELKKGNLNHYWHNNLN